MLHYLLHPLSYLRPSISPPLSLLVLLVSLPPHRVSRSCISLPHSPLVLMLSPTATQVHFSPALPLLVLAAHWTLRVGRLCGISLPLSPLVPTVCLTAAWLTPTIHPSSHATQPPRIHPSSHATQQTSVFVSHRDGDKILQKGTGSGLGELFLLPKGY